MRRSNQHILMFLDNCLSHPHLAMSNIKLCFYPKNTTSRLQAMDQGVITNLKQMYNKHMSNMARIKAKSAMKVVDIIKDIKIFDAILHAKVAWESINPETIKNVLDIVVCKRVVHAVHPQPCLLMMLRMRIQNLHNVSRICWMSLGMNI